MEEDSNSLKKCYIYILAALYCRNKLILFADLTHPEEGRDYDVVAAEETNAEIDDIEIERVAFLALKPVFLRTPSRKSYLEEGDVIMRLYPDPDGKWNIKATICLPKQLYTRQSFKLIYIFSIYVYSSHQA